jgi:hypothetical protein
VEEFKFDDNSAFSSSNGLIVSTKLNFKQLTKVWTTNQYNGTPWNTKYLLRVSYNDSSGVGYTGTYHINTTTTPNVIVTLENAASPVGGTAIPDMTTGTYSDIVVQIIEDQTDGATGTLLTPNNVVNTITYNDQNSLYFSATTGIPTNLYSHIVFADTTLNTALTSYVSETGALKARLNVSALSATDEWKIYTTPYIADVLKYKMKSGVFTLDQAEITVKFI